MLRQSQNELQNCRNLIKQQKITNIKKVYFWKFVGAPVLTQALLKNPDLTNFIEYVRYKTTTVMTFIYAQGKRQKTC